MNKKYTLFIIFIVMYHIVFQNGIEKIFCQTYFPYYDVKRPLESCKTKTSNSVYCIGMPSGHAECSTVFFGLLYLMDVISFPICLFLIFIVCLQRVIFNMHTVNQVIMGSLLGGIYTFIYYKMKFSPLCFLLIFLWSLTLVTLSIYKLDMEIKGPIPEWVDSTMLSSIKKKQESPYYLKVMTLFTNAFIQEKTFIDWKEMETYLDTIVDEIKSTSTTFDAVIGIKTGGAIISDYVSSKLKLPNYKIKLSREEYNCNKKPVNIFNDIIQRDILNNFTKYTVCEGIEGNLEGKNVILIDEQVSHGNTMIEAIKYLQEKHVNIIYPTCISLLKNNYKYDVKINYEIPSYVFVWPWGYDN